MLLKIEKENNIEGFFAFVYRKTGIEKYYLGSFSAENALEQQFEQFLAGYSGEKLKPINTKWEL